jgi:hypothetical protein
MPPPGITEHLGGRVGVEANAKDGAHDRGGGVGLCGQGLNR